MKKNSNRTICSKVEIIFYVVLALITIIALFSLLLKSSQGDMVEVRVSGKVIGTYPLNENKKVDIEGKLGGKNILVIRNGKAKMDEADCSDKTCMKSGEIYRVSESIICLPHEVVVEIKKNDAVNKEEKSKQKEDDVDVIAK